MICGIGIDIIELDRMEENVNNNRFIDRILTNEEKKQLASFLQNRRKLEYLAGRFSAKEAMAKATGTGIGKLSFQDMEVLNDEYGAPRITVKGYEDYSIWVSISHSNHYVVAQVVMEKQST